jgi:hypothetical protein
VTALEIIRRQAFLDAAERADLLAAQIGRHAITTDHATAKVLAVAIETAKTLASEYRSMASRAVTP